MSSPLIPHTIQITYCRSYLGARPTLSGISGCLTYPAEHTEVVNLPYCQGYMGARPTLRCISTGYKDYFTPTTTT